MTYEFTYTLDSLFEDLQRATQREAITIPQLPKEEGYITQDVQPVIAVMEPKDKDHIEYHLNTAVATIWEYIAAWVDDEGLAVPTVPKENEGDPDVRGIYIRFKENEVTGNRVILVTNGLQELIKHVLLADWYSIYAHRPDIGQRHMHLSVAVGENLRSNLIKNNASRPYRFY